MSKMNEPTQTQLNMVCPVCRTDNHTSLTRNNQSIMWCYECDIIFHVYRINDYYSNCLHIHTVEESYADY